MILCPTCGKSLPASAYGKDKRRKSGLQRVCKACRAEANKQTYKRHKERHRRHRAKIHDTAERVAHLIVGRALRRFELEPEPCEVCGTTKNVVAHHDDYTKPMVVRWLCKSHHKQWHDENGPGRNAEADGEPLAEEYGRPRRTRTRE